MRLHGFGRRARHRQPGGTAHARSVLAVITAVLLTGALTAYVGSEYPPAQPRATLPTIQADADLRESSGLELPFRVEVAPSQDPVLADDAVATPDPATPPQVPQSGTGDFVVANTDDRAAGREANLIRYSVEVESDLAVDVEAVAAIIEEILTDDRSWAGMDHYALARSDRKGADIRVLLATPDTTDELCAPLETEGEVSCRNGPLVVLNALRWTEGAEAYGDDVDSYRQYLVNHEVGHALGQDHAECPASGSPAPVMLQQTFGLDGCVANPWPQP